MVRLPRAARRLALLSLLVLPAACASPDDLRRADAAACEGYGFKPDSTEMATCLQRETLARQARLEAAYLSSPSWQAGGGVFAPR